MSTKKTPAAAEATPNVAGIAATWFNHITGRTVTDDQAAKLTVAAASIGLSSTQYSEATMRQLIERKAESLGIVDLTQSEFSLFVSLFGFAAEKLA